MLTADGFQLQQRDRKSIALLNQISGQYIGNFFDEALRVEVGIRRPFFKRELDRPSARSRRPTASPIAPASRSWRAARRRRHPAAADGSIPIFVNQGDRASDRRRIQPALRAVQGRL